MADFLLELLSEEIPARMQAQAAETFAALFRDAVTSAGLACDGIRTFVTPRRLAISCETVSAATQSKQIEKKGPRVNAPEAALAGFLRASGLTREQLSVEGEGNNAYYVARLTESAQAAPLVLAPALEAMFARFPWPKSMRWGTGDARWVRPLQRIVCLLHGNILPIRFAGLAASNVTCGHRFLAPASIVIHAPETYEKQLRDASVIADAVARRNAIEEQLHAHVALADFNACLRPDARLLEEVTGLVEWPVVYHGRIDEAFMDLPKEVLLSEMRGHQKYFAVEQANGKLASFFLVVANMPAPDAGAAIVAGNERVLRARLADGRFFYEQDQKIPLSAWAEKLAAITFHAKLGSIADKIARMQALAEQLIDQVASLPVDKASVHRAIALCKADLATGMVGEFPELQGVMGRYYALAQNEEMSVADAIRDHYLPLGPDSPVPSAPVSLYTALTDKLDTLRSLFEAGEKPTGSKDPFALRRSALGVIRIVLENNMRLNLTALCSEELRAFFHDRLIVRLRDSGIRHDVAAAALAKGGDIVAMARRARALHDFLETPDGAELLAAYKRACNILAIEEKKDGATYHFRDADKARVDEAGRSKEEREFQKNLLAMGANAGEQLLRHEDFTGVMHIFARVRPVVYDFLDNTLIVVKDDAELRESRLRLLALLRDTFHQIADFSQIEGG